MSSATKPMSAASGEHPASSSTSSCKRPRKDESDGRAERFFRARKSKFEEYLSACESMYFGASSFNSSAVNDNFRDIFERMYPVERQRRPEKANNGASDSQARPKKGSHLDLLLHPARVDEVCDFWGPWEVAVFQAAMCKYGKSFHKIAALLPQKNTKDCVEFYYVWKKTSRYKAWKSNRDLNPHLAEE
eukprot:GHVL01014811.1.p1 GENE.GHVL01014811.1~~GHVL01014811.1.p1  ORF type:complete len:189 (+),score=22.07 GHVL01014811.1:87-653(+)